MKCQHCGGGMEHKPYPDAKYCSEKCKHAVNNAKRAAKKKEAQKPRPCKFCLKEFIPHRSNVLYCSDLCNARFHNHYRGATEHLNDPEYWAVTTPYGSHGFDWWVKCSMEGQGGVSHV